MTTLRRRTASESGCEESSFICKTASIVPTTKPENHFPVDFGKQFVTNLPWNIQPQADAFYKKTDIISPVSFHPTSLSASQPIQYLNYHQTVQSTNSEFRNYPQPYSSSQFNIQNSASIGLDCQSSTSFNSPCSDSSKDINSLWQSDVKEIGSMASRDRTQEFSRIIRSQQGNLVNGSTPYKEGQRPKDFRQYAQFMQRSKLIGRNISSTYAKLEKLTHLAKKRSLFDDSQDHEIQELTGIIRHDLNSLTKQLEDLQSRSRLNGSSINGSSEHLQKHSANLVGSLQTKVASITRKFKDVLEVRTENLKKQAERREQYAGGLVSGELPPQAVAGHHQGSVLLADEAAAEATRNRSHGRTGDFTIDVGTENHNSWGLEGAVGGAGAPGTVYHQQLELMEEQDAYLQSRADTMKTIETTIVELGTMFTQLATMVKEQEEIVHRIDSNVDEADLNVEAAHSELLKYFKSVSSNRWLMFKVFGFLILFFIIFVVFMA